MGRDRRRAQRATVGPRAQRHADALAVRLGKALRDARRSTGLTQAQAAARAGLSQSAWSRLEIDGDSRFTLATWDMAGFAVGATLDAFLRGGSAADQPRDAVHLAGQELIIRTALLAGWRGLPEEQIDRDARSSRAADVLLHRRASGSTLEYALMEVFDWFDDVGEPTRAWPSRLIAVERYAIARMVGNDPLPHVSGCWVIRATRRNRQLVGQHRHFFRARFPGSGRAWLAALTDPAIPMPDSPAILWVSVAADRLFPARLG